MTPTQKALATYIVETFGWHPRNAEISVRAGSRCEYCDLDFLASPENYKLWSRDHIVPLSKGGADELDNLALACRTCNMHFKGVFDPRRQSAVTRAELVEAAKQYIRERKALTLAEITKIRSGNPEPIQQSKSGTLRSESDDPSKDC